MPAEWEPHRATWIAWPHHEPDWPGKLGPIPWVYAEIVRALAEHEPVEILCQSEDRPSVRARRPSTRTPSRLDRVRLHLVPTDRVWLRDSAPTGVIDDAGAVRLLDWGFNAWAKYDNWQRDDQVGTGDGRHHRASAHRASVTGRPASVVLEGGGIDVNGDGLLLVTEEWLLSDVQVRNPGLTRRGLRSHLPRVARHPAHDLARRRLRRRRHPRPRRRRRALREQRTRSCWRSKRIPRTTTTRVRWTTSAGSNGHRPQRAIGPLRVVRLPFPRPVIMHGERLPASYANFYIANGVVIVPTFNDPNDRVALNTLAEVLPRHRIVGIHAVDLVWGLGTLHCLTQQEPAAVGRGFSPGITNCPGPGRFASPGLRTNPGVIDQSPATPSSPRPASVRRPPRCTSDRDRFVPSTYTSSSDDSLRPTRTSSSM